MFNRGCLGLVAYPAGLIVVVVYDRFFSSLSSSMQVSDIREILKVIERGGVISLAGGLPDPTTFPRDEIAEIARDVVERFGEKALQYSPTRGVSYFLEALRVFAERHGVRIASDDSLMVTVGSQQALYLIGESLLDPGDIVFTEEPAYLGAVQAFKARGAVFHTIPIDENGMRVDVLEERLRRLRGEGFAERMKLIYTVPTCNNPAGTTMPNDRRKYMLELAEEFDLLIVEDDPYRFIAFEDRDVRTIKFLDGYGRTIYMSSFSKILAPGLRLGWIVAPEPLISRMEIVKQAIDLHTPSLSQFIAAEAIHRGVIERHLPRIREVYRRKRDIMLEALQEYMPSEVKWTRPIGGMFVWVWFPSTVNTRELFKIALEKGVAFVPGDAFYPNGGGDNTARLNFSYPPPHLLREGVRRVAEAYREYLSGRS
ncbi:MAG: aminotransferase [Hyperthermus sp.]|nr:MAG: aminotransferase [Hyperthermus sp.]